MEKKQFKAESQRLLDLMINSIYTHKEIFLRELISNASDAIDKMYYKALTEENLSFAKENYYIKITPDKEGRTLTISDTGIGMTAEELEDNLGVIAKSGSLAFKKENAAQDGIDLIGQFGVGFYSAFMVSETVTVISKAFGSTEAFKWVSGGSEGYTIEPWIKEETGTDIILKIKENTEEEKYDEYLEKYRLQAIIKKYSDYIRYPIKMDGETINSMVPIWKKSKNELTKEDYENFYAERHYGFDKPLRHLHVSVEGAVSYQAILFIPEKMPYDFHTREYEKGLELYANGVMIMNKCPDLLPDYFSFVKGIVDSEDLSLNISREILQHDRQLKLIAKNIRTRIKNELENILQQDRSVYDEFFKAFGRQLKYGLYSDFGANREILQDLLMFYSSHEKKLVTLAEYVERMPAEQKYIYYASGESYDRIAKMPQTELVAEKGYEILFFADDVDEFAIKMLMTYREKEFRSVSGGDLGIEAEENKEVFEQVEKENQELFSYMKNILAGKVKDVRVSKRLKNHPVCLANEGELSIEMEKILSALPNQQNIKAEKILEINPAHDVFKVLKENFVKDKGKVALYTELLYNQVLLIEGLSIDDPVEFSNQITKIMV